MYCRLVLSGFETVALGVLYSWRVAHPPKVYDPATRTTHDYTRVDASVKADLYLAIKTIPSTSNNRERSFGAEYDNAHGESWTDLRYYSR